MDKQKLKKEYKRQFYSYDKGILFNPNDTFNWILSKIKDNKMKTHQQGDKMKGFYCAETYDSNYRAIQEKLKAIGRLVQEHKKEFNKTDWGYVGDLDNCISKLDDVIDFLKNEE